MRITMTLLLFLFFFSITAVVSFTQVPQDFQLIANAGGGEIWQDYNTLRIDAQGNGTFAVFNSRDFFF